MRNKLCLTILNESERDLYDHVRKVYNEDAASLVYCPGLNKDRLRVLEVVAKSNTYGWWYLCDHYMNKDMFEHIAMMITEECIDNLSIDAMMHLEGFNFNYINSKCNIKILEDEYHFLKKRLEDFKDYENE